MGDVWANSDNRWQRCVFHSYRGHFDPSHTQMVLSSFRPGALWQLISSKCHKTRWVSGHRCGNENYEEANTRLCDRDQCLPCGTSRRTVESERSAPRGD